MAVLSFCDALASISVARWMQAYTSRMRDHGGRSNGRRKSFSWLRSEREAETVESLLAHRTHGKLFLEDGAIAEVEIFRYGHAIQSAVCLATNVSSRRTPGTSFVWLFSGLGRHNGILGFTSSVRASGSKEKQT